MPADEEETPDAVRALDKDALCRKYQQERDKRLRPDGNDQYLQLKGRLAHDLEDPYMPRKSRAHCTDHVTFAFIGGGFGGLVTAARLVEAGIRDVRIVEKGGDFGGTWYWNRYPGAQCDTASMVYMPLLEETGHMPSEKYARGPEILAHCQRIGHQYGLYEHALLHTAVQDLAWDAARAVWRIRTDRGDAFTAQFIGLGTSRLHVPKLPGITGIESFQGHSFHTSRWDYGYTGGDRFGAPMARLADQRVAIIGTGATAVQCVPHLARDCGALWVFQRTPSSVDVRANAPIDAAWFATIATPGWQQRWLENFTANHGLSMLLSGAEVVLPPPAGFRDPAFVARAWGVVRERGVTLLAMVPTVMTALLGAPRAGADAQGVRLGLTGGSPLPTELANRFEDETGVPVRNILGMTECAGVIAIEPARAPRTPGSCGLPLPFSEVIVDGDGVLRLRGPNVGPGYTDRERNAGSFDDGGWLITGDIGHVDAQGRVYVTGRAKDVIIRGAHNIDPGVIEEALMRHPGVMLAAAVGEPDEYAGELPVAYVVVKPGVVFDAAELLAFATSHVPERAAMPKRIECLPALPLTAIGKVYKPALRVRATERVLRERLQRAGLEQRVSVEGEDRSGRMMMRFVPAVSDGDADARQRLHNALKKLMAGFVLAWELQ